MSHRIWTTLVVSLVSGLVLSASPPARAGESERPAKFVPADGELVPADGDSQACVAKSEWRDLYNLRTVAKDHNPPVAAVERRWEVEGLGFEAVLPMPNGGILVQAYPKCYQDVSEGWYGFVVEDGRVGMLTNCSHCERYASSRARQREPR